MFFLILLLLSYYTPSTKTAKIPIKCNGVVFRNAYHEKQLLFQGLGPASSMMMHEQSGELFFSHHNHHKKKKEIMSCRIERKTCRRIKSVHDGSAIAYDREHNEIYFGGSNGIYKFNFIKKTTEYFAASDKTILGIYIRKNFYFIDKKHKLYVNHQGEFIKMPAAKGTEVDNIFVSKRFEIYIANKTGLYKTELKHKDRLTLMKGKLAVRQITEDFDGNVYFCAKDGIYMEDVAKPVIKKVARIDQPEGMTFISSSSPKQKKTQLIYSTKHGIYRLQPSKHNLYCLNALGYIKRVPKSALLKSKAKSMKTKSVLSTKARISSSMANTTLTSSKTKSLGASDLMLSKLAISIPVNRTSKSIMSPTLFLTQTSISLNAQSSTILAPVSSPTILTSNSETTPDRGTSLLAHSLPQSASSPRTIISEKAFSSSILSLTSMTTQASSIPSSTSEQISLTTNSSRSAPIKTMQEYNKMIPR